MYMEVMIKGKQLRAIKGDQRAIVTPHPSRYGTIRLTYGYCCLVIDQRHTDNVNEIALQMTSHTVGEHSHSGNLDGRGEVVGLACQT